jgi:hypothetical protein
MKYSASRAYAPTSELAIMTIMINNDNNQQLLALFTTIVNYWNYWLLFAWNFIMFIIRLIFIIVASSYYCQLFRLLCLFVFIAFIVLKRIIVYIEIIEIYVIACACRGWYKKWMVSMADIRCILTDLGGHNCDGEEFQPKHPGVLSDIVIGCSLGLHTAFQWMPVDGGDSQQRVCSQIHRHKWCTWNPMPVRRQDRLRVLAWLDGSLLVAPSRCQRNWSLSHHNVSYSTGIDQRCKQKYARHWWTECA